jgi:hypothetical protein
MSANTDGDFLVYDIRYRENGVTEGIFLPFKDIEYLNLFNGGFEFEFSSVAPIEVGKLNVQNGKIFIGDVYASKDSDNFVSIIDSHGEQTVIAWVGYKFGLPTPLAITATGAKLTQMIKHDFRSKSNPPAHFENCIKDSLNELVGSRLGGAPLGAIAEINENIRASRSVNAL